MTDRRRFLFGAGVLAAGSAACAVWPSQSDGSAAPKERLAAPEQPPSSPHGDLAEVEPMGDVAQRGPVAGKPNFVIINADDLGWGQLGAYGQTKIQTPRLDQMANEGLRFTDAYAPAPVCAPSRASMLTGLHAGHNPVRRNPPKEGELPIPAGTITIGDMLQAVGYKTGLFGKWGFGRNAGDEGSHPNARGFGEFFGYMTHHAAKSYYPRFLWNNRNKVSLPGNFDDYGALYGPDLIMDRALEFIENNKDEPFLLLLTLPLPHAPSVISDLGAYGSKPWNPANKTHAAQITRLDSYTGLLLDTLKRHGLDENTIVIFTGDNGAHEENGVEPAFFNAGGPFKGIKRNLYEGGIRVPFIVWSPKLLSKTVRKRTTHQTTHIDLMATMADYAGAKAPANDGLSLRKVFNGAGGAPTHEYLYWLRLHAGSTKTHRALEHGRGRQCSAAVRFGDWKLIGWAPGREYSAPNGRWVYELYDLSKDPGEKKNLVKSHPAIVSRGVRYIKQSWRAP
ncbi:arylsulfatase [Actinocorallia aurea]